MPPYAQMEYMLETTQPLDADIAKSEYNINLFDRRKAPCWERTSTINMTTKSAEKLRQSGLVKDLRFMLDTIAANSAAFEDLC